jgi:hypothetical protein
MWICLSPMKIHGKGWVTIHLMIFIMLMIYIVLQLHAAVVVVVVGSPMVQHYRSDSLSIVRLIDSAEWKIHSITGLYMCNLTRYLSFHVYASRGAARLGISDESVSRYAVNFPPPKDWACPLELGGSDGCCGQYICNCSCHVPCCQPRPQAAENM